MLRIANTDVFDRLVENNSNIKNSNGFAMVPYDQDKALAAEQTREDLEVDQRYYAEVINNPMNYGRLRDRQLVNPHKSTGDGTFKIPRPRSKVYDRGKGVDVPLEFLVSYSDKINRRKRMMNKTSLIKAPVNNVRIYKEDLRSGNFDTNFYGNIVPALARYVATHCYSADCTGLEKLDS